MMLMVMMILMVMLMVEMAVVAATATKRRCNVRPHIRGGSQRVNMLESSDGGKLDGDNRVAAAAPNLMLR